MCAFCWGARTPGQLKAALIRATLGGIRARAIAELDRAILARVLKHALYADALRRIEQHRRAGDYLVLLSASTDLYVPALAGALGFAEAICTGLEWRDDVLVGYLTTPNRRGEEKVRCLERLRAQHPRRLLAAYGNAGSDIPHLRMADRPVLVNGRRAARTAAKRYGIPQETWH